MHLNGSWPLDKPYDAVRKLLWYDWSKFWFNDPQYRAPPPSRLANTAEGKIATRHPSVKILVEKTPNVVVRTGFHQAVFSPDASHFLFVLRHPVLRCGPNLMRGCDVQRGMNKGGTPHYARLAYDVPCNRSGPRHGRACP